MYIVGADHPNKEAAQTMMARFFRSGVRLVTDAEVYQEILHRYRSIGRIQAVDPAFDLLTKVTEEVFPIDLPTVQTARNLFAEVRDISARDAIHVAAMRVHHVFEIASFDTDYDRVPGLRRISS